MATERSKRPFRDAHPAIRCQATVILRDGTAAQCGRKMINLDGLCLQHATMANRGKEITRWR